MPFFQNEPKIPELKQQAIDWLVRLRSEDMSEGEMVAFADWLTKDNRHSQAFAAAEDLFNEMAIAASNRVSRSDNVTQADEPKINSVVRLVGNPQPTKPHVAKPHGRWFAFPLALAAAWLFAMFLVVPKQSHLFNDLLSDYHTATGEIREIELADGSRLLLNTNSAVSIDFNDSKRQIALHHGQVRFTVAKDQMRPFEVTVDDLSIRALGTVFEVSNLDGDESGVIVQEHAVSARIRNVANAQIQNVSIEKGQQLRHRNGAALSQPEPVALEQATAWQNHRLLVNDRPLGELIAELNRYRTGRIFLLENNLQQLRISGVFSLDHPDSTLNNVQQVLGLKQTRVGAWWLVLHR